MKKTLSALMIIAVLLLVLFTATSCFFEKDKPHPIDEFITRVDEEQNCQISVTYTYPSVGSFGFKMKIDGNVIYIPDFSILGQPVFEETYIKTTSEYQYIYAKDDYGRWTREKIALSDDTTDFFGDDSLDLTEIFNSKKYEKVKGEENTYRQKSNVIFENAEDVIIVIEEDFCSVEMSMLAEGTYVGVKLVFSKLGEIDLTLPRVN